MYNPDTELLFPLRVAPTLRNLRGEEWRQLIDRVTAADADPLDQAGFALLMVRMNSCLTCTADSFRAMRGCTACARQTVRRFRGEDSDLVNQFEAARGEVARYLAKA
jgi:predicted secreted protein